MLYPTPLRWESSGILQSCWSEKLCWENLRARSLHRSHFILDPVVSFCLELECEFFRARLHNTSFIQHMHKIRNDIVEQTLVVCYHDDRIVLRTEFVHTVRYDAKRIDVET